MRTLMRGTLVLAGVAGLLLAAPQAPAAADDYPTQAITFVVPWPAGGRTDIIGRMAASVIGGKLGQPVAVVNRVGGGGALGSLEVLEAEPDGYTVLVTTIGNHVLQPVARDTGYAYDDFVPIGQIASDTMVLATAAGGAFETLEGLIEAAREAPDTITYGAVPDVLPDRAVRSLADAAGIELAHIPTTGDAEGVPMAAGGHIDLIISSSIAAVISQIEAGQLRPLVIFDDERHDLLPDVPTARELGYEVVASPWTGLAVAGGTSDHVVEVLRETLAETVEDPSFVSFAENAGITLVYRDGPEFGEVWAASHATFAGE